jgi:hypothetical protein
MNDDPAEFYHRMRISTAALLGYGDADRLTAEQAIRTDRALTLRLVVDHLQGRQMQGIPIDVKEFVAASEALERMVGGNPEQTSGPDHDGTLLEVVANIDGILRVREQADAKRDADLMLREEMAAVLAAGGDVAAIGSKPAAGDETQSDSVPPSSAAPTGGGGWPAPEPAPPQPPKRVESDVERMARVNAQPVPAHYLKSTEPEPWRDYVNADGSINPSPWRRW